MYKKGEKMSQYNLELGKSYVEKELASKELKHLKVTIRGKNIVIYSEYEKEKENRCRFTQINPRLYIMNMADHTGKWESTPFEDGLEELLKMVMEQFPWVLADYEM